MKQAMLALLLGLVLLGAAPAGTPAPAPSPAVTAARVDCTACHNESGWHRVTFDHNQTRMPLLDAHATVACRGCHQDLHTLALDTQCASCHQDVHSGRLGNNCQRCHDQKTFRSGPGVEAHGQTRFPLYGRHAFIPCDKCHQQRGDRTFGGVTPNCVGCHDGDLLRTRGTQTDHTGLGPSPDCRNCHVATDWRQARFPEHDGCFPISAGNHGGNRCNTCHTSLNGLRVGNCQTLTARCTNCHDRGNSHNQAATDVLHAAPNGGPSGVPGYAFQDRKCYECHSVGFRR